MNLMNLPKRKVQINICKWLRVTSDHGSKGNLINIFNCCLPKDQACKSNGTCANLGFGACTPRKIKE